MKVKGNLQVSGTLEGITFTDGSATFSRQAKLSFAGGDFYLRTMSDGGAELNISGDKGVTFTDGSNTRRTQNLVFNALDFYLSNQHSTGRPQINLKDAIYLPFEQETGAITNAYLLPNSPSKFAVDEVFAISKSGTVTCGFYIIPAATPNKNGSGIPGLDPINVSSTGQIKYPTALGTINSGDSLLFSIYSTSSGKNVRLGITLRKL